MLKPIKCGGHAKGEHIRRTRFYGCLMSEKAALTGFINDRGVSAPLALFFARTRQLLGFNFRGASPRLPAMRRTNLFAPRNTADKESL